MGSGAILALCAASLPQLALAANECGAGTSVTCTSTGNNYTSGISYTSATDQTVNLSSGVVVDAATPNTGLSVTSAGATGAVSVNGATGVSITSEGDGAPGVNLNSLGGAINANLSTVVTKGAGSTGVNASSGSGTVNLTLGSVTTSGLNSVGINGESVTGDVNINAGSVSTTGAGAVGIDAANGTGRISITATTVTTSGANATGIFTANGTGATAINAGAVSTTGAGAVGIDAVGFGSGATIAVSTTGPVTTTGANATGISVSTPGAISITTAGNVATSGSGAAAVSAVGSGSVKLNVNSGAITSTKADAVDLTGDTVQATIGTKGSISGATAGLAIDSTTAATVNNAGTISSSGGYAVFATGGPVGLTNSGTITGAVSFDAGGDTFNNSGTFNATANSAFAAAGTDVFNNTGVVNVAPTATTATAVTFTNLGAFNNKGLISLQNGHAGDSLTLPGTFNGGTGSTLAVDVAGGTTPVADTLNVLGAASGSTAIKVNTIGGGLAVNNVVVATTGAGSSANAFTLSPSSANVGFIRYDLVSPTAGTYALVGSPNASVVETVKVQEAISDFWKISADAWQAHMAAARDAQWAGAGAQGVHGWGQLYGGARDRRDSLQTTTFGVSHVDDLSYDSNNYGFQGGVDAVMGPWVTGLTAGYGGQDMRFHATNDKTMMQGYNVGAYAGIMTHGAYITVLGKYNDDRIQMGSLLASSELDFAAHTYGGQIDMGYRLGVGGSVFVEPVGSFSYSRTYVDSVSALNSTFAFNRYTGEEGKAGLRFGAAMGDWMGAKVIPYGSVLAVHEFRDNDGFVFSNGGYNFDYFNHRRGTYGHATAGLNFLNNRGVDGFIQGDLDFASGTGGGGARVGVRFAF
ncbi:autotransporter outer membrane beta-barrel domain-containing protein [Caulobacter sp. KR2-114]|uniref:autotransporter outer membrane beta-barrel domain-containing protein n=1 Tax=Caulobacter sp. KR2-114 TaxID=3400912 RepID=UPI003C03D67D